MQIPVGGLISSAFCRLGAVIAILLLAPVAVPSIPGAEVEAEISPWDWSASLRGGAGYKDNLLLSDLFKESSAFTFTEVDFFVFRVPLEDWELTAFVTGEDRRYWQSETVEKEQLLLATLDVKKSFAERWKAGWNLQYFYIDQIFDASVSEGLPLRVRAKMHRFSGGPSLERKFSQNRRLEMSFALQRQEFGSPLDDSWEFGPKILFAQKYGDAGSEITATVQWRHRGYDTRVAPGTLSRSLEYDAPEFEAGLRHYWDSEKHWKSRVRAGFELNRDNGSGFFDYRRWRLSKELAFTQGGFEATLKTGLLHYEYLHQLAPNGRLRRRSELEFGGRLRQQIFKHISLFAEAEHEWVLATDDLEGYRATTVWGGIEWEVK